MRKKKNIISILCLLLILGMSLPIPGIKAAGETVKVGTDNINIRKGPGLSYPVVAKAKRGDKFTLLAEEGDWIGIQLPNGQKGWLANWLVSKTSKEQNTNSVNNTSQSATVTVDGLRVRKGPGTSFQVIGTVQKGNAFSVITTSGNWVQLHTSYGNGWVSKDYVKFDKQPPTNNNSGGVTGKITTNTLNIRSEASLNSKVIGKLHAGETVKIISQKGEWTEISYLGMNAWISSDFVELEKSHSNETSNEEVQKPTPPASIGKTGTVTATSLIVRKTGSLNGKAITSVSKGQSFKIIEEVNNWAKIEYKKGAYGWVASWFLDKTGITDSPVSEDNVKDSSITIIHDGSNIRKSADTQAEVIQRANAGETFQVISVQKDWYEIKLAGGKSGFIAGWIVSVDGSAPQVEKPGSDTYLQNKKIIIDPGHGGRDNGTTGANGTIEKTLTIQTAKLLYNKLKASGANVTLTRSNDTYIPLASRVYSAHYNNADAFISIHYDSANDRSVRGMTTYYHHPYQKNLAANVHTAVSSMTNIKDRGYRNGDYYVLRENKRNAILMELGYLSNPAEEMLISSAQYQEAVATGIAQGLARYFKN